MAPCDSHGWLTLAQDTFGASSGWLNFQLGVFEAVKLIFAAAFGACIGSLTNVLVYRIPRGLDYVTPTSRCTSCDTPLTWRENIPIFGWLILRGRCRFCRSKVSPEYILVETFVAVLWAFTFAALYMGEGNAIGFSLAAIQPEWALNGFAATWPLYVMLVLLFSCLTAMTLVDAKTFTIPPVLTNVPTVLGLVTHVSFAVYVQGKWGGEGLTHHADNWTWAIASPGPNGWAWVGAAIGGVIGIVVGNVLLHTKLLRRSFEDYAAWEEQALKEQKDQEAAAPTAPSAEATADPTSPQPTSQLDDMHPHLWVQYPHARREVFRELLFLAPALSLAYFGSWVAVKWAGQVIDPATGAKIFTTAVPLWLDVLAGVLLGYLIGGGVVWFVRIAGTLGFGKEALGLGDVHMMAAVGACLGWIDPVLAFFGAAFLGVGWYVLGKVFKGVASKVMPFGPYLAMGTILVFFAKPGFEHFFAKLMKLAQPVSLP